MYIHVTLTTSTHGAVLLYVSHLIIFRRFNVPLYSYFYIAFVAEARVDSYT